MKAIRVAGFIISAICLFSTNVSAQDAVAKKIIEEGTTNNQTQKHLDILCNRFGGRLAGSDAYENAALWAVSQFEKWGFEVSLEEAGETRVGFNRGPWSGRILGAQLSGGDKLHFATPSYTSGTKGVQRGHVLIEPKTQAEFDRIKGQLKGAWVLVSGNNTGWPLAHGAKAERRRDSLIRDNILIEQYNRDLRQNYYQKAQAQGKSYREIEAEMRIALKDSIKKPNNEPALFYKQMAEAGVLGFIQSSPVPITALYDRTVIFDPESDFDNLPSLPDIKLDYQQYEQISTMVKERRYIELEFDIRNHFKPGPVKFHNVVAKLKGSKYPDKMVMISGHLDAFDVATGGVDCGVGVAPAMEVARLLSVSGAKPKQSIVIVLFAAEEFGLLGSQAWVKAHNNELSNISNLFNRDGGPLAPTGVSVPEAMKEDFEKASRYLDKINPDYKFTIDIIPARPQPKAFGGNDATVFAVHGVPTIHLNLADVKGYNFDYREIWHTERDTYNKSIDEYQEHTSVVQAVLAYELANMDHILSREGLFK